LSKNHDGEFYVGLIHFLPGDDIGQRWDYHEVIQGQLYEALQPGQRYQVEIWVREDSAIMQQHMREVYVSNTGVELIQAGNLGVYFLTSPLDTYTAFSRFQRENKPPPQVNFREVIHTDRDWVKLSTTFVPDQAFQFFLIGNFFSDAETATSLSPERDSAISAHNRMTGMALDRIKRVGYLCLDAVSVSLAPKSADQLDSNSLEQRLLTQKRISFSTGVLFDSGEAELRPDAYTEIEQLVQFMRKYPAVRIGIAGHTDAVGTATYNQDLSANRALAVFNFLKEKGIPVERLDWKAFGESRPVADNTTEEGRQQNRRVECIVLQ
jgi:outer membrane protein OmpA-like peptidoglycan-associated protein